MVNSGIIRVGADISMKTEKSEGYSKMGKVAKIHLVETGYILELEDEITMIKVKTKDAKPKDPDAPPKKVKSVDEMLDSIKE